MFCFEKWDVITCKHVGDGLVTGPEAKVEKVLASLSKQFLLKIEPELQTGQETMYLGRVLTKLEHGFALRPAARLYENFLLALGPTTSSAAGTPCAKQELCRED